MNEYTPVDPWGRPYSYSPQKGAAPIVMSWGADGHPGGVEFAKDISNSTLHEDIPETAFERQVIRQLRLGFGGAIATLIGSIWVMYRPRK